MTTIQEITLQPPEEPIEKPEVHSVAVPFFSFITMRPTLFMPGLLDVAVKPLRMVKWSVDLWPIWDPTITGTYRVRVENIGTLPLLGASHNELVKATNTKLVQFNKSLGTLSGAVEPEVSFTIKGFDVIKAIITAVFQNKIRVRSQATVTWLLMSKNFDIDATIPVP